MIDIKDVRIDIYTNSTPNVKMTLTHLPTGLSVKGEGHSSYKLKNDMVKLLDQLDEMVNDE